jgi:lipoate-protein ligase B
MGEEWYRLQGIEVEEVDRGGAVTYHGPGQLVGYPIMRIGNVREYVHTMERAMVQMLADEKVDAVANEELTGIWVGERKIGSIGVHVQSRVTTHGFAINVDNDLQPFEWIVPCGLDHVRMTSLYLETGMPGGMPCFRKRAAWRFAQAYGLKQRIVSLDRLRVSSLVA